MSKSETRAERRRAKRAALAKKRAAKRKAREARKAAAQKQPDTPALFEELEPRILYSTLTGVEDASLLDPSYAAGGEVLEADAALDTGEASGEAAADSLRHELVFVDTGVEGYEQLVDDLRAASPEGRQLEVILLDTEQDGIEQISDFLQDYEGLDAIHIVSHGDEGAAQLGNTWLTSDSLALYETSIEGWGGALSEDADLLFYGCDLAGGESGEALVGSIAKLTGADVAASSDLTGAQALGGDWDLEVATGAVETDLAFSAALQQTWGATLETANFQEGVDGYTGTEDTVLDSGSPTSSAPGGWSSVTVDLDDGSGTAQGLIQFADLFGTAPGQIPLGATITSATLTIDVFDSTVDPKVISLHRMNVDWSEASTWDSLSGGIQLDDVEAMATADATVPDTRLTGAVTITGLEGALQAWSDGDANHGWAIITDSDDGWDFSSSAEGTASLRPKLTVTYSTNTGSAIWAENGSGVPETSTWDGTDFGPEGTTANVGTWRTMQGAEAPTRDEKIVVGVEEGGTSTGMMWNGSSWSALSLGTLGSVSETYWYGADVAYESQSGDGVLVWNDSSQAAGDELRFSVWDGSSWTTPASIAAYTGAEPQNLKLVSSPSSDEMVLVVSDGSADDYVLVWNGSSWGNALMVDASGTAENDQSGIAVAYESQSGQAMVAYGKDNDPNAYHRIWNGSSWEPEVAIDAPGGVTAQTNWISLASDPSSDRIAISVLTSGGTSADVWFDVWNGSSWETPVLAETGATGSIFPNAAIAFEAESGQALAVYGQSGQPEVRFRTWDSVGGWSAEQTGPNVGATPNSMTLDSDPASNRIMLSVQDSGADLNMALWDGASFGAVTEHETDTGETKNQPFLFLWDQTQGPVTASTASLWMTTEEDVASPSGANGLDSWEGGSVLSFDDPNLTYDPSGTDGTLNNVLNLDNFVQDGDSRLDAIHYVGTNITVGTNAIPLQAGDILLSSVFPETLVNSDTSTLAVTSRDVFIFRPDSLTNYSLGGTFIKLIDGADLSIETEGITLVERTTTIGTGGGATTLDPGDFLFTDRDNAGVIYRLQPGVLGDAATNTGTITVLVDGTDIGIDQLIHGVELVESDVTVGDRTLTSGQLLVSLYADDVVSGTSVSRSDIFILNVTDTGTATTASAEAFFTGADIGFDTWQESPWAVSLVPSQPQEPQAAPTTSDNTVSAIEDTPYSFTAADFPFSDVNAGDNLQQVQITALETVGSLKLGGVDVTLGQVITRAAIDAGDLTFEALPDEFGSGYDSFEFRVHDGTSYSAATSTISFVDSTFDADAEDYAYADIANASWASGSYDPTGGVSGGGLRIDLAGGITGGVSSGGWSQTFNLTETTEITVSTDFRLIISEMYEANEYGELFLKIDGVAYGDDTNSSLIHTIGDGNGGAVDDSGWLTYQTTITLAAGNHTLELSAVNNDSTAADEYVEAYFDNVSVTSEVFNTMTVDVDPVNDAPVITGTSTGSPTEDSGTPAAGTLTATDVDDSDGFQADAALVGTYGTGTIDATGNWTYTIDDANPTVDALNAGDTLIDTITVLTVDGTSQDITLTIQGANDAPVITGTSTGSPTEDSGTPAAGTLSATDVDDSDGFQGDAALVGTYGTGTIDAAGNWTYTIDDANPTVDALNAGDTLIDMITVLTVDGTSQDITLTIQGANDAPVITGTSTGSPTEDSGTPAAGTLSATDVDDSNGFQADGALVGTYGTGTIDAAGSWTYTIDDANPTVDALNTGDTLIDTISVLTVDGTSQDITLTIQGANDAPVVTGTSTGSPTEDSGTPAAGTLTATDIDDSDGFQADGALAGTYGTGTIDATGNWTYTIDDANPTVDALNAGDTLIDTISVLTVDGTSQDITLTIQGANDAPVITGTSTGSPVEDSGTPAVGTLTATDVDDSDGFQADAALVGTYGTGTIDATGNWTYTIDDANPTVDALNAGDTLIDTLTVLTVDGTSQDITLTIQGANDAPVITGTSTGSPTEDSGTPAAGTLSATDVDDSNGFQADGALVGTYGTGTIDAAGSWTYTIDDANPTVDALNTGDTLIDTISVLTVDGTSQDITLTIQGANDAPVITGTSTGSPTEDSGTPAAGALSATDVDDSDGFQADAALAGTYGTGTVDATGNWTYTIDDANPTVDALNTGDTLIDTISVLTVDGTSQDITLTIQGANDAPVITGTSTGSPVEDSGTPAVGTLTATDVDDSDGFQADAALAGTYGTGTIDATGNWTYTIDDANPTVDALNAGDTLIDTITVLTVDGTSQDITLTIQGANDAPVITGTSTGSPTEDSGTSAAGTLTATDVDDSDGFQADAALVGTYGTGTIDATGNWTYTIDDANPTVDALNAGDTLIDTISVLTVDGTSQDITLTIQGANDAPVITGTSTGSPVEDSGTPAVGTLTATDVDDSDGFQADAALVGTYGTGTIDATGNWTYTIDDANPTVDALNAGDTLIDTLTVLTVDGTSQDITLTIQGANDAPVITGTSTGSPVEDSGTPAVGTLTATDVDDSDGFQADGALAGTYGTGTIDAAGNWTYTIDDANPTVDALNAGDTLIDMITVLTVDGTSQDITLTIQGANDAPVITGTSSGSPTEDSGTPAAGTLSATDVDDSDGFQADAALVGTYGTGTIDAAGNWTYTIDDANPTVDALNAGDTLIDTITVLTVDGTSQDITLTIQGANDAPVITGTSSGSPTEDSGTPAAGTLSATDVDDSDGFQPDVALVGTYGTGTIDAAGNWTYTIDDANPTVDALNAGDTLIDTITVLTVDGTSQDITLTIQGANDAPVITGTPSGPATEDSGTQAAGTLTAADVDDSDGFQADGALAGTYGTGTIDAAGNWTYTIDDANATVDALNAGDTLIDTITVLTIDGTSQDITLTIQGANDAPVITGTSTGSPTEDTGTPAAGTLAATDVDDSDGFQADAALVGTYGTGTIDATGNWTYTIDDANPTVDALNAGDTLIDTITVLTVDGTSQDITLTIQGANDAPVITGTSTGSPTEDSGTPVAGTLTATDVDDSDGFQADAALVGTYGTGTIDAAGNWTYTIDDANPTVDALNAGDTLIDTITVLTADGTSQDITLTIQGANDAPVITGTPSGTATEDAGTPAAGTLSATDVDDSDGFQADGALVGTYGTGTIDATGNWTYTIDDANPTVDALNAGDTLIDTITVLTVDGTSQDITLTIQGANDAPVITGTSTGSPVEDSGTPAAGTLTATDVDDSNGFQADAALVGTYGTGTVDAAGNWTYTIDDANPVVDALNAGDTLIDTITVLTVDGTSQDITLTIQGANDAPLITGTSTGSPTEDSGTPAAGTLTATDVDDSDGFQADAALVGTYGTGTIDATGNWTYTIDDANPTVDALNAGDTLIDTIAVLTVDGTSQDITLTIQGANDAPVITGTSTGSPVEDSGTPAAGALTATDVDDSDGFQADGALVGTYGTGTIDATGNWTYTIDDANPTVDALNAGDTLIDTITVLTVDGTSQDITLTIQGANDAPVITGTSSGTATEDSGTPAAGTLTATDVDDSDGFQADAALVGTYGTGTIDATGNWTYTIDDANPTVDALNAGDTLIDTITVLTVDGTSQYITLTIQGANDAPVITGASTGSPTEDSGAPAAGALTATDVDDSDGFQADAALVGTYGTGTIDAAGNWTYTIDDANPTVDALNAGDTLIDTITVVTVDGTSQDITLTIQGANDAPVITGTSTGSPTEDSGTPAAGTLSATDVDDSDGFQADATLVGTYGTGTIDAAGNWTYTIDDANPTVDALNAGDTLIDTITVLTVDGTSQDITLTIQGANDAPVITGTSSGTATEDTGTPAAGTLSATDVDDSDGFQADAALVGAYGTGTIDAAGNWTYTIDDANPTVDALSAGDTLIDTITVLTVDGTSQDITLTIQGANDAPVITGTSTGSPVEDSGTPAAGTLTATDVDDSDGFQANGALVGTYGTGTIDAAGNWTYTIDDANPTVDALSAGDTLIDTITVVTVDGTSQDITLTIQGANDAPVITGTSTGSPTEDSGTPAAGTLSATDVDDSDGFQADATLVGTYGTGTIDAAGNWTYTIDDANPTVDALNAGDTLIDTITVLTVDGTSQDITLTIQGANDAPVITGTSSGTATEDTGTPAAGTLSATDVDDSDGFQADAALVGAYGTGTIDAAGNWTYTIDDANPTVDALNAGDTLIDTITVLTVDGTSQDITLTIQGANDAPVITGTSSGTATEDTGTPAAGTLSATDVDDSDGFQADAALVGTYGTGTIDATGNWTYTIEDANPTVDALNAGDTLIDTITVLTVDGTSQDITLTIQGANDAPVITGTSTGSPTEDSGTPAAGTLTATDVDDSDGFQTDAALVGTYGTGTIDATGNWTYTIDDANPTVDALNAGDTLIDTITVLTVDGTSQDITLTIQGANDAPVITGTSTGSSVEDSGTPAAGTLSAIDVDDSDGFQADAALVGTYGTGTIDATGNWTYAIDDANPTVDALTAGDTLIDTITVLTVDGTSQDITLTINGANDAPIITGAPSGTATEDSGTPAAGTLTATDVDDSDGFQADAALVGSYGTGTIDAAGNWTYTIDDANPTVDALNAGDTLIDTITVLTADGTSQDITLTIQGANDAPVVTGTSTGSPVADSGTPAAGTLTATDVDDSNGFQADAALVGTYGTGTIDATGNWTYTIDDANPTVDALNAGDTLIDTITVLTVDGTSQDITLTIQGANDAPIITGAPSGSATEDSGTPAAGTLTATDVDDSNGFQADGALVGTYGTGTIDATGNWTYTIDDTNPTVDALNAGDTLIDTITVLTVDGTSQDITLTIQGANDAPVITGAPSGSATEDSGTPAAGTLTATDVDDSDGFQADAALVGTYGTGTIDATGSWTYTIDDANPTVDALNAGDTLIDTITVLTIDGTSQDITLTIQGANDAPVITGTSTGSPTEDSGTPAAGTLTASDVDDSDGFQPDAALVGTYGTGTIDATGNWTYTIDDANPTVDALNVGDSLLDTITVLTVDGTSQDITLTIQGANDAPVITGTSTGSPTEDSGTPAAGTLTATDVDDSDGFQADAALVGTYGTGTIDATGNWTYTIDDANPTVDALNAGDTLIDTITVLTVDGTSQDITLTIQGANDAPVITGTSTGSPTEDSGTPAAGTLTASDVDDSDGFQADAALVGTYGTGTIDATGSWTYTIDDANATVDALNAGDTLIDTITVLTVDGTSQDITLTIQGADDAPVITGTPSGTATEDSGAPAAGSLTAADVDDSNGFQVDGALVGTYGTGTIDATGNWTYTIDDANPTVDALNAGDTLIDTITVLTVDGTSQDITLTIQGANDVPVITGTSTGSPVEDSGTPAAGTLAAADLDDSDGFQADAALVGTYGTGTIDATGSWTYTIDDANPTVDALNVGDSLLDTITVLTVDGTSQDITLTIQGANDAPVITGTSTGSPTEDSGTPAAGTLSATDVDDSNGFQADAALVGTYGTGTIDATGNWTYTIDDANPAVDALNVGDSLIDTITVLTVDGTSQDITLTIQGANDAPVITGTSTGSPTEDSGTPAAGTLTATDVDDSNGFQVDDALVGTYGTGTIDATGNWTYTIDDANPAVDALNAGDTLIDTITVLTVDGTSQDITLTIQGANDAPVITGTSTGNPVEDSGTPASGALTAADVDDSDGFQPDAALVGTYGTGTIDATGNWTYTIDDANPTVDALNAGDTLIDTITVLTVDGTSQDITLTINGANDAPVLLDQTLTVTENTPNGTPVGVVTASDVEAGSLVYTIQAGNIGGAFAIDSATGDVTVANAAALDHETMSSFGLTVEVRDSEGLASTAVLTIDVNDLNEAPNASDDAFSVMDTASNGEIVGFVAASDPDAGSTLSYTIIAGNVSGCFSIDALSGEIRVANAAALDAAGVSSYELTVEVRDDGTLTDTAAVTIAVEPSEVFDLDPEEDPVDEPEEDPGDGQESETSPDEPGDGGAPEGSSTPPPLDPQEDEPEPRAFRLVPTPNEDADTSEGVRVASNAPEAESAWRSESAEPDSQTAQQELAAQQQLEEQLDKMREAVERDVADELAEIDFKVGAAEGALAATFTSVLALLARGSSMVAAMLSSLPLWRRVDPLAVLAVSDERREALTEKLKQAARDEEREAEGLADILDRADRDAEGSDEDSSQDRDSD